MHYALDLCILHCLRESRNTYFVIRLRNPLKNCLKSYEYNTFNLIWVNFWKILFLHLFASLEGAAKQLEDSLHFKSMYNYTDTVLTLIHYKLYSTAPQNIYNIKTSVLAPQKFKGAYTSKSLSVHASRLAAILMDHENPLHLNNQRGLKTSIGTTTSSHS